MAFYRPAPGGMMLGEQLADAVKNQLVRQRRDLLAAIPSQRLDERVSLIGDPDLDFAVADVSGIVVHGSSPATGEA